MTGNLHVLEPYSVILCAEFLSLDMATGNLRIRLAGEERTYLGTAFRITTLRLPLHHVMVMGMPGGVVSIAKTLADVELGPITPSDEEELEPAAPKRRRERGVTSGMKGSPEGGTPSPRS